MQRTWAGRVELDQCGRCGSLFFDAGELEATLQTRVEVQPAGGAARHACPACIRPMTPVLLSQARAGQCAQCHGLWLERSQVEVLRSVARGEPPPPAPAPRGGAPQAPQTFLCANCKLTHPMVNARRVGHSLLCPTCEAGFASAGPSLLSPALSVGDLLEVLWSALFFRHRRWWD